MLGDSTAAGVGAADHEEALAGRPDAPTPRTPKRVRIHSIAAHKARKRAGAECAELTP
ncbi:hypothetical protein ACQEVG_06065 [Streptomyces sp. CA-135486]|uniref:hypothetical protein n=1 Tax=Streptomyces sp. CA-135486 TaxID=3240049 RepID=UPI003D941641